MQITKFKLPMQKTDPLPHPSAFGNDDFHRARYYSGVIERYSTKIEAEKLIAFAREARFPGLSFVAMLESMARFLHESPDTRTAIDKLIEHTKKPVDQIQKEMLFTGCVRVTMRKFEKPSDRSIALAEGLALLYPKATRERIMGALEAGNTEQGFNVERVIETMQLTEPSA